MKETTLEQFRALAATGEVVPVCREIPGDMDTPVSVLERFMQDDCVALLAMVTSPSDEEARPKMVSTPIKSMRRPATIKPTTVANTYLKKSFIALFLFS